MSRFKQAWAKLLTVLVEHRKLRKKLMAHMVIMLMVVLLVNGLVANGTIHGEVNIAATYLYVSSIFLLGVVAILYKEILSNKKTQNKLK